MRVRKKGAAGVARGEGTFYGGIYDLYDQVMAAEY